LWGEFTALYRAFANGEPSPLREPPIAYADFAAWHRDRVGSDPGREDAGYWRGRLNGAKRGLDLPTDRPRPQIPGVRGAAHPLRIEGALVEALRALAQREGATLFMALTAAYQLLLGRLSGQHDVSVGTPVAGRLGAESETLIGCFINTVVLRTDLSGDPTFRGVLGRVRETVLGAFAHQELPFERVVAELGPERVPGRTPLFEALINFRNTPSVDLPMPGLKASRMAGPNPTAKFILSLILQPEGPALAGEFEYCTDTFLPATIARFAEHFGGLLLAIVTEPDCRISRLAPAHAGKAVPSSGTIDAANPSDPGAALGGKAGNGAPTDVAASVTEQAIAAFWCELLGVPHAGPRDHFFEAGGHSLLAVRLVARVRAALLVGLPVRVVFENPTFGALVAAVDAARATMNNRPGPVGSDAPGG
jgi:hypothetical protein